MTIFSFGTRSSPATVKEDDLTYLRLIRSRPVGPATFHRLIAEYGNATNALAALPDIARQAGVDSYSLCPSGLAEAELRAGIRAGARLIRHDGPDYPALLRETPDAPPVLWVKGILRAVSHHNLAVIGARNASSLGLRMARRLAQDLAEAGMTITAGLARGIDSAAHEASLAQGTVAVMAGGIDVIYPRENADLAARICETGALVTEQPPGTDPVARHFPQRNRIISGLCRGVVVIEAAQKSGSLITARNALDYGREVMAVPGHPIDTRAGGCNLLIRDGAILVRNAEDVITALSDYGAPETAFDVPKSQPIQNIAAPAPVTTSRCDQGGPAQLRDRILSRLGPSPTEENQLIRDLGLTASTLAPALLALELEGRLSRMSGGLLALR